MVQVVPDEIGKEDAGSLTPVSDGKLWRAIEVRCSEPYRAWAILASSIRSTRYLLDSSDSFASLFSVGN